MKKFFALAAIVAVALTSCVTTTEIPDPAGEISFEAYNFKAQSRAHYGPIEDSVYPENEHFGAYAFFTDAPHSAYMSNVDISKVGNVWKNATHTYYWPKGGTLKFWCYSPYGTDHTVTHDKGFAFSGYTTTANLAEQVDLMATEVIAEARPAAVAAVFHHLLSQVCFQVVTAVTDDVATVTLEELTLTNVLPTGDYATADGTYTNGTWSSVRGTALTFDYLPDTDDKQVVNGTETAVKEAAIVIPQTLAKAEVVNNIKVSYKVSIKYAETEATDVVNGTYELKDATTAWEKGKKYIYTITIGVGSDEITFAPEVAPWTGGTVTGDGITVG